MRRPPRPPRRLFRHATSHPARGFLLAALVLVPLSACGDEADAPLFVAGGGSGAAGAAGKGSAGRGGSMPTVCEPGLTRQCVGDGACTGGQACKADGSGWAECKCGGAGASASGGATAGGSGGASPNGGSAGTAAGASGGGGDGAGGNGKSGQGGSGGSSGDAGMGGSGGGQAGTGGTGAGDGGAGGSAGSGGGAGGLAGEGGSAGIGATGGSGGGAAGKAGSPGGGSGGASSAGAAGAGGGPPGTCTTSSQCLADEACAKPITVGDDEYLACQKKRIDGAGLAGGALCKSSSECASLQCTFLPGATTGVCGGTCVSAGDCAPGSTCGSAREDEARLCHPGCKRQAECDPDTASTCAVQLDYALGEVRFACQAPLGPTKFGEKQSASAPCSTGLSIGTQTCTRPCGTNADCGPPFPACKSGPLGAPNGGVAVVKICTSQ